VEDGFAIVVLTLSAMLRVATPLILGAMAGLFSERSGIIDISLEGKMLASAFASATVAALSDSAWIALGAGILIAGAFSLVHGYACITQKGNQVVSGIALNILASGLTIVLGNAWFHRGGQTPNLSAGGRFMAIDLPGAGALRNLPVAGPLYHQLISGHNLIVYAALLAVPLTHWVVQQHALRIAPPGRRREPPGVDTAGISVAWLRYRAVLLGGLLTGTAGTYLAIAQNAGFSRDMTAGQGYIALAALIFGKWRPYPALGACLMFGLLDAIAIRLQGVRVAGIGEVPVQLIQALPDLLTIILLAGFIGKAVAPKAAGIPYVKER
jgi:general nucleoside transport system permease protein